MTVKIDERKLLFSSDKIKDNNMIFLWGPKGIGKTTSSLVALSKLKVNNTEGGWDKGYFTANQILMNLYATELKDRKAYLDTIIRIPAIIIDEIDKFHLTNWREEMIFYLLSERLNNLKKTIIISNTSLQELGEKVGDNIVSRISDNAVIIHAEGDVLR